MSIPWGKVGQVLGVVYRAFLKGRQVTIPGIGPVTLPSQGHTVGGSSLSTPHDPAFPNVRTLVSQPPGRPRRNGVPSRAKPAPPPTPETRAAWDEAHRGQDPKRAEGLATPIYMPIVGFILFAVVGVPLALLVAAGAIEAKTLADDVPGNHLTAQLRAIFARQPAACALGLAVWLAFVVAIVVGVTAHAWWF